MRILKNTKSRVLVSITTSTISYCNILYLPHNPVNILTTHLSSTNKDLEMVFESDQVVHKNLHLFPGYVHNISNTTKKTMHGYKIYSKIDYQMFI